MGRRGNMRGRPGLLFVVFVFVCLVIFYLSWQMLMSPKFEKTDRTSAIREGSSLSRANGQKWDGRSAFRDKQRSKQLFYHFSERENQIDTPIVKELKDEKGHERADTESLLFNRNKVDLGSIQIPNEETGFSPKEKTTQRPGLNDMQEADLSQINKEVYYREPITSIQDTVRSMQRLVHLDLKGAVPNMKYFRQVIPLFQSLGATGLLVEYEDMFPFSGTLEPLRAANSFTKAQLREFLDLAKMHSLTVMPLIQTFGHMEFVLKSAFPELRESSYTPQVVDMTNNGSYAVIAAMITQVLDAHPDATHLHIGCDEVYELGKGASASLMQLEKLTVGQMFLRHVKRVAKMVSSYNPQKVTPVMWDDMLRKMPLEDISESALPTFVDIMVWHYTPDVSGMVGSNVFTKYERLFKSIWIASSFKGATGSRQFYTDPTYHIRNHFSWLNVIREHHSNLHFKGVALTGWQRYDHFATLCELLPVAIPSLAVCLATLKHAGFTQAIHHSTSIILNCDQKIQMSFPEIDEKTKLAKISQDCRFPGSDLYYDMQELYGYTQIGIQHRLDGWLSEYQVKQGFSSPGQLKVLAMSVNKQNNGYTKIQGPLKLHLSSIFSFEDVQEWLDENILERKRRNEEILQKVNPMMTVKVWPRRPLPMVKVSNTKQVSPQAESNRAGGSDREQGLSNGTKSRGHLDGKISVVPPPSDQNERPEVPQDQRVVVRKGSEVKRPTGAMNQRFNVDGSKAVADGRELQRGENRAQIKDESFRSNTINSAAGLKDERYGPSPQKIFANQSNRDYTHEIKPTEKVKLDELEPKAAGGNLEPVFLRHNREYGKVDGRSNGDRDSPKIGWDGKKWEPSYTGGQQEGQRDDRKRMLVLENIHKKDPNINPLSGNHPSFDFVDSRTKQEMDKDSGIAQIFQKPNAEETRDAHLTDLGKNLGKKRVGSNLDLHVQKRNPGFKNFETDFHDSKMHQYERKLVKAASESENGA